MLRDFLIWGMTLESNIINEGTITSLEILSQLALSAEERKQAMADLEDMVDFIRRMQEADTTAEEPLSHIFPTYNVFREDDEVTEPGWGNMLESAPERQGDFYQVPRTI